MTSLTIRLYVKCVCEILILIVEILVYCNLSSALICASISYELGIDTRALDLVGKSSISGPARFVLVFKPS